MPNTRSQVSVVFPDNRFKDIAIESSAPVEMLLEGQWQRMPLNRCFPYLYESDASSVNPYFKLRNTSSLFEFEDISEESIITAMLAKDLLVKVAPVKEYNVNLKILKIKKGDFNIFIE